MTPVQGRPLTPCAAWKNLPSGPSLSPLLPLRKPFPGAAGFPQGVKGDEAVRSFWTAFPQTKSGEASDHRPNPQGRESRQHDPRPLRVPGVLSSVREASGNRQIRVQNRGRGQAIVLSEQRAEPLLLLLAEAPGMAAPGAPLFIGCGKAMGTPGIKPGPGLPPDSCCAPAGRSPPNGTPAHSRSA